MRPVISGPNMIVHLLPSTGQKTVCGNKPVGAAPRVVSRAQLCKSCFGVDRGVMGCWTAEKLGVEKIIEGRV